MSHPGQPSRIPGLAYGDIKFVKVGIVVVAAASIEVESLEQAYRGSGCERAVEVEKVVEGRRPAQPSGEKVEVTANAYAESVEGGPPCLVEDLDELFLRQLLLDPDGKWCFGSIQLVAFDTAQLILLLLLLFHFFFFFTSTLTVLHLLLFLLLLPTVDVSPLRLL